MNSLIFQAQLSRPLCPLPLTVCRRVCCHMGHATQKCVLALAKPAAPPTLFAAPITLSVAPPAFSAAPPTLTVAPRLVCGCRAVPCRACYNSVRVVRSHRLRAVRDADGMSEAGHAGKSTSLHRRHLADESVVSAGDGWRGASPTTEHTLLAASRGCLGCHLRHRQVPASS